MAKQPVIKPYGSWKSPVQAQDIFASSIGMSSIQTEHGRLYWNERRPNGVYRVVCRQPDGSIAEITPPDFDVRTRVHEYGGGEYLALGGAVYFANMKDQLWYAQTPGNQPAAITHTPGVRFADAVADPAQNRLIAVREDHTVNGSQPVNSLAGISLDADNAVTVLAAGNDFYSNPRLSLDGIRLAWLTWNHPNMPWDGTELWVGELLPDGSVGSSRLIAGGKEESIYQPEWSPDGHLYFISDRSGWWNLYRWDGSAITALHPMQAEFGSPAWVFGMRNYAFVSQNQLVCIYTEGGFDHLALLDTQTLHFSEVDLPFTHYWGVLADEEVLYFFCASATETTSLAKFDLSNHRLEIIHTSRPASLAPASISSAIPIRFPTENGLSAHGYYYPPRNADFAGPANERPPLIVMSHGGPTGATSAAFSLEIQYWTTRGIAVLDVDYGGSTGYGREYRERLKGQWGIVDVDDCINGARYLVQQGWADTKRLAIRGGSAGGYTTLCALTFHDVFQAGASYFGVSDLEALAKDTHKFESRYLDGMVGPYPEKREIYIARSPIHAVDQLACPMILLQGLEDPVVPPNQAEMMYQAVKAKGLPVAYVTFPGERHGFVKAENNSRALESELYFYSKIFHFNLADEVEPVEIENLEG